MKPTQSTVARLESGRGQPSTRAGAVREGDGTPAQDQFSADEGEGVMA
jgi:hypothetical protein